MEKNLFGREGRIVVAGAADKGCGARCPRMDELGRCRSLAQRLALSDYNLEVQWHLVPNAIPT